MHSIKKLLDKRVEHFRIKCPFNDITVENPFCQRQCGKNRKSSERIGNPPTSWGCCKYYVPSPTAEECLMSCSPATYCPGTASICCSTVHSAFINKNKLVWRVLANTKRIVSACFSTPLQCNPANLSSSQIVRHQKIWSLITHLFHGISTLY